MIDQLKPLMGMLCSFSQKRMGFEHPPSLFLKKDSKNSKKPLGKTAFYDPGQKSITIYVTNRHPKDILRSFAHELVHHTQNLRGDLSPEKCGNMGNNYAQSNKHMRNMEKEAYLIGNMCFRDWEDGLPEEDMRKYKLAESKFLKENKKVNVNELKEIITGVVKNRLMEGPSSAPEIDKKSQEYVSAQQLISSIKAVRDASPNKMASLERFAVEMLKATPKSLQQFNDALNLIKKAEAGGGKTRNFAFSSDPYTNRQANAYYKQLQGVNTGGIKTPVSQLEKLQQAKLQKALQGGVKGNLTSGLDATNAINNDRVLDAKQAAAIQAAVSTFTRSGNKIVPATRVKVKSATPEPSVPDAPNEPDIDNAVAMQPGTNIGSIGQKPPKPQAAAAKPVKTVGKTRKARQQNTIVSRGDMADMDIEDIGMLQQRLVDAGYASDTLKSGSPFVDGDFGPATIRAVRKLQRDLGFRYRDGVIGKNTIARIKASNNPKVKIFRMGPAAASADRGMRTRRTPFSSIPLGENQKLTKDLLKEMIERQLEIAMGYDMMEFEAEERARNAENKEDEEMSEGNCSGKREDKKKKNKELEETEEIEGEVVEEEVEELEEGALHPKRIAGKGCCMACGPRGKDEPHKGDDPVTENEALEEKKSKKKKRKPDYIDIDGDGNRKETMKKAAADLKKKKRSKKKKANESKIQTPEQENTLYEQRFTPKNGRLFEKLLKEWTK